MCGAKTIDYFPRRVRRPLHSLSIGDVALNRPARALSAQQGPHLPAQ